MTSSVVGATSFSLPASCEPLVARIDAELARFLAAHRGRAVRVQPPDADLFAELQRVVGAGGKRLRPVFCCLGYRAAGREVDERIVRAAAALELLHTFAIVHDDVMDRSPVRRGRAASWVAAGELHRSHRFLGDAEQYGISVAVLVGDLALILADRALLACGFPPDVLLPALDRYDQMRVDVVAGQHLDVVAAARGDAGETEARRIAVLKSGGYTVEGPLHIGAILGGGGPEVLASLSGYGIALGEAFQLRDDVLGVFGDPALTGKSRDSDLREGKRTLLVARAIEAAGEDDAAFLRARLGHPDLGEEEVARARAIVEATGALEGTLSLIDDLQARALAALRAAPIPAGVASVLEELALAVTLRGS